jgi:hypothetical protein
VRGTGAADVYIVQGSGNKANSVEWQVPKGNKYEKIILIDCDFFKNHLERNILFYKVNYFLILPMQDLGVNVDGMQRS